MNPDITYAVLTEAKAYLCWDRFPTLSVQLIEMTEAVSYFLPPSDRSTVIVYYEKESGHFSTPIALLFHEAGHHQQYLDDRDLFLENMNRPVGKERMAFETDAWNRGKALLEDFMKDKKRPDSFLEYYTKLASRKTRSYG